MTNQEQLHAWLRGVTGTSGSFNDDMLAFLDGAGYTTGDYNGRLYAYLYAQTSATGSPAMNDLMQQFAVNNGFQSWNSVTNLV